MEVVCTALDILREAPEIILAIADTVEIVCLLANACAQGENCRYIPRRYQGSQLYNQRFTPASRPSGSAVGGRRAFAFSSEVSGISQSR